MAPWCGGAESGRRPRGCPGVTQFPPSPPQTLSLCHQGRRGGSGMGDPTLTTPGTRDHHRGHTAWRRSPRRSRVPPPSPVPPPHFHLPSPSISLSPCLTAADAPALQEEGIKLGWRNFKDCCRPEGLRSPRGDGQSCRINPIGSPGSASAGARAPGEREGARGAMLGAAARAPAPLGVDGKLIMKN